LIAGRTALNERRHNSWIKKQQKPLDTVNIDRHC
jgi:hypothetical protein